MTDQRACENCGRPLNNPDSRRRFCSQHCAGVATYRRHPPRDFWEKINRHGPIPPSAPELGACWIWLGAKTKNNYGHLGVSVDGPTATVSAHRRVWELTHGPIPTGLCVLHHCDVRTCVNPSHLFLGTKSDNTRDMIAKGRHGARSMPESVLRGVRNHNAKLSDDDVRAIRQRAAAGESKRHLATAFPVTRAMIKNIVLRRAWKHVA